MIASKLISNTVIPLKTSDTGQYALDMMDDYKVSHLPIVNEDSLLGLISESDILSINNVDEPIGNHKLSLYRPFVEQSQHIYDVIKIFADLKLSLLPVLDNKNNYLGVITLFDLVQNFSKISAVQNPGGIIVLEVNHNDYSLSEISQIIESDDAKVLSLYIHTYEDSTKMDIIIKINKIDLGAVLQTFNRYNYTIKESYSEREDSEDLLKRYELLMNYLNI
jgi:acetoin utilization protein AcuB